MHSKFIERDLNVLWHPCTQMKDHETFPLIPIKKGKGIWLEDFDGKRYIDAISSWWVNLFGHSNPDINQAIKMQLEKLEHVMLAGFSHEPVVSLSERLVNSTPDGLNRCFYADNGSSAVEVALKMSFHYWHNKGQHNKKRFMTLSNSYHGETLGALSVGNVPLYKDIYGPLLLDTIVAPSPDCFLRDNGMSWEAHSREVFIKMKNLLEQYADELCAVIVEPLVQCAGYMRMYHPVYLSLLREACDHYGVHLIADEIAVGFGRTGSMFACEQAQMTAFLHSHSYTGNPLGCSAALATLNIFSGKNVIQNNALLAECMRRETDDLNDHPHVAEVRQHGMILAIEMVKDKKGREPYHWKERRGLKVYKHALEQGVILRPLGNVIYLMSPYVITEDEIKIVVQVAKEGIELATSN